MPDLADRISRAAVAALDLAPFDDRFASLSRQVLAGGAARFGKVVDQRQAISYVIPVGVAGERIDYGALVLQPNSAGLLWRGVGGVDQHAIVSVTSSTPATYSTVPLGGESWLRFSIGSASRLTFLVPPVTSRALVPTLIEYFAARPGPAPTTVLPEPDSEPAAVSFPDEPTIALPTPTSPTPLSAVENAGPIPTLPAPVRSQDDEATQIVPQVGNEPGEAEVTRVVRRSGIEATQDDMTQVVPQPGAEPDEAGVPRVVPQRALDPQDAHAPQLVPEPAQDSPWAPVGAFDLYRDEPRVTPTAESTRVLQVPGPTPVPEPAPQNAWGAPAALHEPVATVQEPNTASSVNLRFFLIGLLITLGVGALALVFQLVT